MAIEITIPRLGWSMEEGVFSRWLKKEGDTIRQGDPLFELEGEKAIQEIEALDAGVLRIPANGPVPGSVVHVGSVVGYLVAQGETLPVAGPAVRRRAREAGVNLDQIAGTGGNGRILAQDIERASSPSLHSPLSPVASPRARRLADELNMDWTQLAGSGAGGRIREQDVLAARRAPIVGRRIPLTSRRKVIAQRMVASRQQTVPVTLTTKADAANLVNLREQFKTTSGQSPIPSYQDIITKLVVGALRRHPLLAGRWDQDAIVLPSENEVHIGMAVDTDDGLLVAVLHNAPALSLVELAARSRQLVSQARAGKLSAAEMHGSVFTITNLGAFGIDAFTPIINMPETAILGLGAIRREPVVLDGGDIVSRHQLTLSLSFDHRILDGAPAARFLQDIATAIANPSAALLS